LAVMRGTRKKLPIDETGLFETGQVSLNKEGEKIGKKV